MKQFLISLILGSSLFAAHPGETIYQTLCAACHGTQGEGVGIGANQLPPLKESNWVKGDARRMTQVVLHGLQGPIAVNGKNYNLVMPPHGNSMTDQQIADVISYVRTHLGNQEKEITIDLVKEQRKQKDNPEMPQMWTAETLLKKFPLPAEKTFLLKDLLSYIYHGNIKSLADLRAKKAQNVEEEKDGLISLRHADRRNKFGLTWEGWLDVPQDGDYEFIYDTDDGGAITINGKEVITRDRVGAFGTPSAAKVALKKGRADIKIEYYEFLGEEALYLQWNGPGVKNVLLSEISKKQEAKNPTIFLSPPPGEALMYRNFIQGTDARGIGVGYSEAVNLAFSADSTSLDMIWSGSFMNAGRHWTGRGQGFQAPPAYGIIKLNQGFPFAMLPNANAPWPSTKANKLTPLFKGYELNQKQQPTFKYQVGDALVSDEPLPGASPEQLTRTLSITHEALLNDDEQLYFRVLSGKKITQVTEREFSSHKLKLTIPSSGHLPVIRGNELLIPIPHTQGVHQIQLHYSWN